MNTQSPYPHARRDDHVDVLHGLDVPDPYRWLEDDAADDTNAWLDAQQALLGEYRGGWPMRQRFADRVESLMGTGFHGPPTFRGDRQFFVRRRPEQEHGVLHCVDGDGGERVLVDPQAIDQEGTTTLDSYRPSPDGTLLAYQLSEGGTEESSVRVMDVATGDVVDSPIDRTRFSPIAWLPDGSGFYYVRQLPVADLPEDERQYHRRVWLHRVGEDPAADAMVFGAEHDKEFIWGVSISRDGRWLVVTGAKGTDPRTEVYLADLAEADLAEPTFVTVQHDVDAQTSVNVGIDGRLYVWTDLESPRGRLLVTDPTTPTREHWQPLVDEDPVAVLNDFTLLEDLDEPRLLVSWTRHAVGEVSVHALATGARVGEVALPGLGSVGGLLSRYDGGHEAWFTYTDHVTPPVVYRFDGRDSSVHEWARPPGAFPDLTGISARLVDYTSYDGETVRMFVVTSDDGSPARPGPVDNEPGEGRPAEPRPTILYGYGGFGISMTPGYSPGALAWVEAGGVYAVACLRGGGEEGEDWHRAGMGHGKQRVFDDFHAAAEWLCENDVTRPDLLGISGGSNGGLLVGAALTQRPDLYRSVVCSAPLLDMVRFEQHGLGRFWSGEYGTAADADDLKNLLTYSPYHRVREGTAYPATLFTVFGSDTRVDPLHARKMCAALQAATTADARTHPVLMRVEREVGHGARAVSRTVALSADTLAFQAWTTGLDLT